MGGGASTQTTLSATATAVEDGRVSARVTHTSLLLAALVPRRPVALAIHLAVEVYVLDAPHRFHHRLAVCASFVTSDSRGRRDHPENLVDLRRCGADQGGARSVHG
eukprot:6859203-Prymnesium_polylepis.1